MNFEESLDYLLSLGHETLTIKLGLRNTELLLASLDQPQNSFNSVQIAGTNGKGSTAVVLESICRAAGIKTGLFTSPHLISITERIVIEGQEISGEDFARHATSVRNASEELLRQDTLPSLPTFFEQVTAIALVAFKEAEVSLAILETGLGGRLDATTVAGADIVAITPLALDHQEYLGETIEEIAAEKAAIIRRGVDAVVAPQSQPAMDVVIRRCRDCGVTPRIVSEEDWVVSKVTGSGRLVVSFVANGKHYDNVTLGLRGRHQIVNSAVSIQLAHALRKYGFDIPELAIMSGVENADHAGRLEFHEGSPSLLLDGAHNPAGASALRQYLQEFRRNSLTLVFGAMKDKKLDEIAAILFPVAQNLILTQPDSPRSADAADVAKLAESFPPSGSIKIVESPERALAMARQMTPPEGLVCVTGSLYLVGEVKALLEKEKFTTAQY